MPPSFASKPVDDAPTGFFMFGAYRPRVWPLPRFRVISRPVIVAWPLRPKRRQILARRSLGSPGRRFRLENLCRQAWRCPSRRQIGANHGSEIAQRSSGKNPATKRSQRARCDHHVRNRGSAAQAKGAQAGLAWPRSCPGRAGRNRSRTGGTPGGGGSGRPRDRGRGAPSQAPPRGGIRIQSAPSIEELNERVGIAARRRSLDRPVGHCNRITTVCESRLASV